MRWPAVALSSVTDRIQTVNPKHGQGNFAYVDLSAVDNDSKVITQPQTVPCADAPSRARQELRAHDVLVSTVRPNLNSVAYVPEALEGAIGSTGFTVLRALDELSPRYLYHWVQTRNFVRDLVSKATGASYPAVSDRIVKESRLPLPPIAEQRRIADILDRANALRVKRREGQALLGDLTHSIFRDTFGGEQWPDIELRALATRITKGTTPTSVGLTFEEAGVPFLRVTDLIGGLAIPSEKTLHISKASHRVLARSKIVGGEVLISIAGTIGRVATVPTGLPEMNCNQAVAIVCLGEEVELDYIATWLQSADAARQMGAGSVTATIANLSLKQVGDLRVPLPPRNLQRKFSIQAAALQQDQAAYKALLAGQHELFFSLQEQMFGGKL